MTERNIRLLLEYDGSTFHGWQRQPNLRTVQGALEAALKVVLRVDDVYVKGSGRTDAGVHAWAQVANVRTDSTTPLERIRRGVNALAGEGVRVVTAEEAPEDFDALGSACGKVYGYRILNRPSPSPLLEGRAWWLRFPMDLDVLKTELATLPATADWSAYRASDCGSPDPVKTLRRAELREERDGCHTLVFEGSGFLKQMVRILVGTAIEVGRGRFAPGSMVEIRNGLDRTAAGQTAPAHGLYMERVLY
ncbi:MAG: tRNA pseudouridine(38-40) synthase TruA [Deltaproteobacteria bacterium]|nr:tRNA pseudouridine(38-40) synthase TruA [Deltaproteobacteria bacterium]